MTTPVRYEVEKLRRRIGVTQPILAQLLDVHHMTVSRWERGDLEPNHYKLEMMRALARAPRVESYLLEAVIKKDGAFAAMRELLLDAP